ncbi:MAG: hypothetical protein AB7K68_00115 [Bacteriovoracia bacterium]
MSQKRGSCDGETCNPDTLTLQVKAQTQFERSVRLIVQAEGPTRGDDWCRVLSLRVTR